MRKTETRVIESKHSCGSCHTTWKLHSQNDSDYIDNAAVEAASEDLPRNSFEAVSEQADLQVSEAEVAQSVQIVQVGAVKHQFNALAKPWPTHIQDELCSEEAKSGFPSSTTQSMQDLWKIIWFQ